MSCCQQWCRWFLCCECLLKPSADGAGLLTSKYVDDSPKSTQYYRVRRISRFGNSGSREDVDDSCNDLAGIGEPLGTPPVETWTEAVQPGADSLDAPASRQRGRWHSALHVLRPKRGKSKERTKIQLPSITLSSPDIVQDTQKEKQQSSLEPMETKSSGLEYSTITDEISSVTVETQQARWLRSQSMQDINSNSTLASVREGSISSETESTRLARSFGLEKSLYVPADSPYEKLSKSKSTDTLSSLWSPDKLNSDKCFLELANGLVQFTASYNQKNKKLLVHISNLENLPPKGCSSIYDMVIKLTVLPSDKKTKTTQVLKGSLNPSVEEDFHFSIKEPVGKVLRLSVYDADVQGKYDAVGHALFNMEDVLTGKPRRYAMKLYKQSQPDVAPGNIHVCLRYESQEKRLSVVVTQARNLLVSTLANRHRHTDKYNTYVKVTFYCAGGKIKSKKSGAILNNRNPQYNHSSEFRVAPNYLDDCYLVISVIMKGLLRKDLAIGRLVLGPHFYAEGRCLTPWGLTILNQEPVSNWFRMYL